MFSYLADNARTVLGKGAKLIKPPFSVCEYQCSVVVPFCCLCLLSELTVCFKWLPAAISIS